MQEGVVLSSDFIMWPVRSQDDGSKKGNDMEGSFGLITQITAWEKDFKGQSYKPLVSQEARCTNDLMTSDQELPRNTIHCTSTRCCVSDDEYRKSHKVWSPCLRKFMMS